MVDYRVRDNYSFLLSCYLLSGANASPDGTVSVSSMSAWAHKECQILKVTRVFTSQVILNNGCRNPARAKVRNMILREGGDTQKGLSLSAKTEMQQQHQRLKKGIGYSP